VATNERRATRRNPDTEHVVGANSSPSGGGDMLREIAAGSRTPDPGVPFLTHHAQILLSLAAHPAIRERDIAGLVGITERSIQRIISELVVGGYVDRTRVGRRNCHHVHGDAALADPFVHGRPVYDLLTPGGRERRPSAAPPDREEHRCTTTSGSC